jgi:3-dehydroquinate dehydratase-2
MPTVLLLNGPNLNLLGSREPEIYGSTTLTDIETQVSYALRERKIECEAFQSNSEGKLIDWLHKQRDADFLLLNPGALTHTSVGLRDAVLAVEIPFLEIHLSNVHQREEFRHHSYFSDIAIGALVGLGVKGYLLATQFAADSLEQKAISAPMTDSQ